MLRPKYGGQHDLCDACCFGSGEDEVRPTDFLTCVKWIVVRVEKEGRATGDSGREGFFVVPCAFEQFDTLCLEGFGCLRVGITGGGMDSPVESEKMPGYCSTHDASRTDDKNGLRRHGGQGEAESIGIIRLMVTLAEGKFALWVARRLKESG